MDKILEYNIDFSGASAKERAAYRPVIESVIRDFTLKLLTEPPHFREKGITARLEFDKWNRYRIKIFNNGVIARESVYELVVENGH